MGKLPNGTTRRFLESLRGTDRTDCIMWPFARLKNGYAVMTYNKRVVPAHRVMCEMQHGVPIAGKMYACHSCGNGHLGCVNPNHLRWGTPKENVADARAHGTLSRGSKIHGAKLTEGDVQAIRAMYAQGNCTQRKIAQMYGVSNPTLHSIVHRTNWAWLD